MHIPAYQIHNVLTAYSSQLCKERLIESVAASQSGHSAEIQMSRDARRRTLVDKIAVDIVQRITCLDSLMPCLPDSGTSPSDAATEARFDRFVFNTVDACNRKSTRTLSIENSIFLIERT